MCKKSGRVATVNRTLGFIQSIQFCITVINRPNYVNNVVWPAAQQCTAGYVEMSGRCLRVVNVNRRWSEAQRDCSNTGGRLASVLADTDPVMTAVGQISGAGRVWIGLKKTRTDWQYTTGKLIWFIISFYFIYRNTQPSLMCASMQQQQQILLFAAELVTGRVLGNVLGRVCMCVSVYHSVLFVL